jgi:hypothetical protein
LSIIWCAISGHGYGHAARTIPVINELGRRVPDLKAVLRTTVPAHFFRDRVTIPWELQPVQQDIGCVQKGPLYIDVPATWDAHARFHAQWEQRVTQEVSAMQSVGPQVILADTPYLAGYAGLEAGIPTVALATFTWDEVLEPLADPEQPHHQAILAEIRQCYKYADFALRIAPGLPLRSVAKVLDIGPIAQPAATRRQEVRAHLGLAESDQLVLIGFGGIPLDSLPWDRMVQMQGYRFVVDSAPTHSSSRIHARSALPYSFKTLLASADVIMTKPGYGTIVEAVALGLPVIYVRRYNFADEPPLVEFLHRYGRGSELSLADFVAGQWEPAFDAIQTASASASPPPCTGAADAAQELSRYY